MRCKTAHCLSKVTPGTLLHMINAAHVPFHHTYYREAFHGDDANAKDSVAMMKVKHGGWTWKPAKVTWSYAYEHVDVDKEKPLIKVLGCPVSFYDVKTKMSWDSSKKILQPAGLHELSYMIVLVSTIPTARFNLICCVSILCGKVIGIYVVLQSVVTWVICVWPVSILACLVSLIYILSWAFSPITSKLMLPGMTRTILLFPGHKISIPSEMVEGQEIWAEHSWSSLHAWSLIHAGWRCTKHHSKDLSIVTMICMLSSGSLCFHLHYWLLCFQGYCRCSYPPSFVTLLHDVLV